MESRPFTKVRFIVNRNSTQKKELYRCACISEFLSTFLYFWQCKFGTVYGADGSQLIAMSSFMNKLKSFES